VFFVDLGSGHAARTRRAGTKRGDQGVCGQTVLAQVEKFTLADMMAQLPAASSQLIKKVLAEMKTAGKVRLMGRGRGARWELIR